MKDSPLVLCLTNRVAAGFTANCLLAVGAKPVMVDEPSEAEELSGKAGALLVNLGTVETRQAEAIRRAVDVVQANRTPWVLDPVGVQLLSYRRELARELIARKPTLVRGNQAEISFLGALDVPTLATGRMDVFTAASGETQAISGGVGMLQTVTATGCAQGGICAAFLGRGLPVSEAALAASRLMKGAGERAWEKAKAPGSFQTALVDALWELSHD